jgi:hypothetical protein
MHNVQHFSCDKIVSCKNDMHLYQMYKETILIIIPPQIIDTKLYHLITTIYYY